MNSAENPQDRFAEGAKSLKQLNDEGLARVLGLATRHLDEAESWKRVVEQEMTSRPIKEPET